MGGRISGVRTRVRTLRAYTQAAPAAGAEQSIVVPGGHVWRTLSVLASLTTDATVGNRLPVLTITVDGSVVWRSPPGSNQAASLTVGYFWADLGTVSTSTDPRGLMLPDWRLPPGAIISTVTGGIVAGDQWTAPVVSIEDEWVHGGPIDLERPELQVVEVIGPAQ